MTTDAVKACVKVSEFACSVAMGGVVSTKKLGLLKTVLAVLTVAFPSVSLSVAPFN